MKAHLTFYPLHLKHNFTGALLPRDPSPHDILFLLLVTIQDTRLLICRIFGRALTTYIESNRHRGNGGMRIRVSLASSFRILEVIFRGKMNLMAKYNTISQKRPIIGKRCDSSCETHAYSRLGKRTTEQLQRPQVHRLSFFTRGITTQRIQEFHGIFTSLHDCHTKDTSIKLWHGKSGKELGAVDTNQLKNNMASLSPNGRFLAAAAFTADVKVWEIVYSKDAAVKEVSKVMQLKGHKSAVTCLCFTPDSEKIITASKDGSIRIWNINVRYHLDEDPKTLKVFPIPLHDSKGVVSNYDHISVSPDGIILATTSGSTLQWLCAESGKVMDTADKAHDGQITGIAWAAQSVSVGGTPAMVLSTSGSDKKVKLWLAPKIHPS